MVVCTSNADLIWPCVGWESLIQFVENSILNGSKEVALAAISCLQTNVNSHSLKVVTVIRVKSDILFVYVK